MNGLLYKDARKQLLGFEEFVRLNTIIPLTLDIAEKAAQVYAKLKKQGLIIGHTDTFIAATAMINGYTLVTNNTEHFSRVDGLIIENWKL